MKGVTGWWSWCWLFDSHSVLSLTLVPAVQATVSRYWGLTGPLQAACLIPNNIQMKKFSIHPCCGFLRRPQGLRLKIYEKQCFSCSRLPLFIYYFIQPLSVPIWLPSIRFSFPSCFRETINTLQSHQSVHSIHLWKSCFTCCSTLYIIMTQWTRKLIQFLSLLCLWVEVGHWS